VRWARLLFVAVVAIAAHAVALRAGVVRDDRYLLDDARVQSLARLGEIWSGGYWGEFAGGRLYRPVTSSSLALGWAAFGAGPLGHHAVNLALHTLNAALLLAMLRRLWPDAPRATLAAALLFAVHPALSEAVAPIAGRSDLLAATFSLIAIGAALRGGRALVVAASAALAVLSKESAAALVVILPAAAWLRDRRAGTSPTWRTRLLEHAPLAIALGACVALRAWALAEPALAAPADRFPVENPLRAADLGPRLLTAISVLGRYAGVLAWPVHLRSDASFDEIALVRSPIDLGFVVGLAAIVALGAATWRGLRRGEASGMAALLALGPIAIVANVVRPIGTIYGERFLYLPAIGVAALLVAGRGSVRLGRAAPALLVAALALLSARSWQRERVYASDAAFAAAMVRDSPRSAKAWQTRAVERWSARDLDAARDAADRALAIAPDWSEALAIRARIEVDSHAPGAEARAERWLLEALDENPRDYSAALELGRLCKDGDATKLAIAETWLERAASLRPDLPDAPYLLGGVRLRLGRAAGARSAFEEALRRRPGYALALYGLGALAVEERRFDEAEARLREAIAGDASLRPTILGWLDPLAANDAAIARLAAALRSG
jgi:protein O-mannosyl-transferase